jgi:hypothetical protein
MIKYEKKSYQIHDKVVEYIEATFDDSNVTLSIPVDPANSDYQRYLNPEAEQFTPIDTGDE